MAKNKSSKAKVKAKKPSKPASKAAAKPLKAKAKVKAKPAKAAPKVAKAKAAPPKKVEKVKAKAAAPAKLPAKAPAPAKASAPVKAPKAAKAPPTPAAPVALKGKTPKQKAQQIIREALTEAAMVGLPEKEVILTNADGLRYCKVADCDELATSDTYCRFHYLLNWKKIQLRKRILAGDKLDRYIEELTARYPDKFLDMIRKDLANEKDFLQAIQELEIDDSGDDSEFEDDARTYIDEVRGVATGGSEDEEF